MRPINLLPPEIRERQRAKRLTTVVAAIGLLVIVLLAGFYLLQQLELSRVEDDLEEQRAINRQLEAEIADLRRFDEIVAEIEEKEALLATLLANEVRWSAILRDISLIIPSDAWLESLSGQIDDPTTGQVSARPGLIGSISFEGVADAHPTVAVWLTQLERVRGFLNPWISNSSRAEIGEVEVVDFSSTVDLSEEATVRGRERA